MMMMIAKGELGTGIRHFRFHVAHVLCHTDMTQYKVLWKHADPCAGTFEAYVCTSALDLAIYLVRSLMDFSQTSLILITT